MQSFFSGGVAGVVAKTTVAPFERIKIIYTASNQRFSYKSAFFKGIEIVKNEGWRSLWRGNIINCTRVFFYSSIVAEGYVAIRSL